jgi:hypothetical protein
VHTYQLQGNFLSHDKFVDALSTYLDKLHASHTVNQQSTELHTTYITATIPYKDLLKLEPITLDSSSALARYFKAKNSSSSLHPYISEKLKACILENIHTSIRLARQGNRQMAKLHTDIARQALLELGHFLSTVECNTFINEVEEAINCCAAYIDTNFRAEIALNKH